MAKNQAVEAVEDAFEKAVDAVENVDLENVAELISKNKKIGFAIGFVGGVAILGGAAFVVKKIRARKAAAEESADAAE